jgi:hypothetical protein
LSMHDGRKYPQRSYSWERKKAGHEEIQYHQIRRSD